MDVNCSFYFKLPLELRQEIMDHVLWSSRIKHRCCHTSLLQQCGVHPKLVKLFPSGKSGLDTKCLEDFSPLATVSKAFASDAQELLWSSAVFDIYTSVPSFFDPYPDSCFGTVSVDEMCRWAGAVGSNAERLRRLGVALNARIDSASLEYGPHNSMIFTPTYQRDMLATIRNLFPRLLSVTITLVFSDTREFSALTAPGVGKVVQILMFQIEPMLDIGHIRLNSNVAGDMMAETSARGQRCREVLATFDARLAESRRVAGSSIQVPM